MVQTMAANKIEVAIILQGGGALGAYEWGAIRCLVEHGYVPKFVSGVSIGAMNAAAVAGAPDGDMVGCLNQLWKAITLRNNPFFSVKQPPLLSIFGNPAFWASRSDLFNVLNWTSMCQVNPLRKTLADIIDFKRLNDPHGVHIGVNSTSVRTGEIRRFCSTKMRLTTEHILASGALPPMFPPVEIDGELHWDGGLSNNTPVKTLLSMMSIEEQACTPIFCVDLFPAAGAPPVNLIDVQNRMAEIQYESRLKNYISELSDVVDLLHPDGFMSSVNPGQTLLGTLKNIHAIHAPHAPLTGAMDFSEYGIKQRRDVGYHAMEKYLSKNKETLANQVAKVAMVPQTRPSKVAMA